jgi:hypothetical protein
MGPFVLGRELHLVISKNSMGNKAFVQLLEGKLKTDEKTSSVLA